MCPRPENCRQRQGKTSGGLKVRVGSEGALRAFLQILPTLLSDQSPRHVRVSSLIHRSWVSMAFCQSAEWGGGLFGGCNTFASRIPVVPLPRSGSGQMLKRVRGCGWRDLRVCRSRRPAVLTDFARNAKSLLLSKSPLLRIGSLRQVRLRRSRSPWGWGVITVG